MIMVEEILENIENISNRSLVGIKVSQNESWIYRTAFLSALQNECEHDRNATGFTFDLVDTIDFPVPSRSPPIHPSPIRLQF